jgi:hypothetical protein
MLFGLSKNNSEKEETIQTPEQKWEKWGEEWERTRQQGKGAPRTANTIQKQKT